MLEITQFIICGIDSIKESQIHRFLTLLESYLAKGQISYRYFNSQMEQTEKYFTDFYFSWILDMIFYI